LRKKLAGPVTPRGASTRDSLLEAASVLMSQRPDVDITLVEIAQAAGANSSLVGYYFGNKDGLLLALMERNMRGGLAELQKIISSNLPAADKIALHISGLINLYYRLPYHNRLMTYLTEQSKAQSASELGTEVMRPLLALYSRLLEEGERSGELRRIDPMFFYFSLMGACDRFFTGRYSMQELFGITEIDKPLKQRFIEHTVATFIPGLLAEPRPVTLRPSLWAAGREMTSQAAS